MRIVIANQKGGVGKTVSAVNLAYAIHSLRHEKKESVLLIDGDEENFAASDWVATGAKNGVTPPFGCVTLKDYDPKKHKATHLMLDTKGGEGEDALLTLSKQFDLLIIPSKPEAISLRALIRTIRPLVKAGRTNYRVLLTDVASAPSTSGEEAKQSLLDAGVPVIGQMIRRATAVEDASNRGICVRDVKRNSRASLVWMDYTIVAREIFAQILQQEAMK
ncbi:ParA family protein [Deinococcus cellulosilyticus]|uniref:Chromosome partitioning protein ParA n=1 Tax=Deinococcus cellulosilyticus (strain DSM 18568 / NBRC 106333 / KACC 11606 / 5516J-15) TaxID=1223518 RepID=A0A511NBV8_DEIC1|nr:ParA family protein [Deinococcus cellulosilyticus]GEM49851.1 chromosome partitioning protein ParA [Deinococcus cellulosilyticus NBRC 106333 = KACC 11606]